MNILVTGSEGYIGSVLCPHLLSAGHTVIGVDTAFFGEHHIAHPQYHFISADIRTLNPELFHNVDAVIHLAALSNDPLGALSPEHTQQINFEATARLGTLARQHGVHKFLFASSCSVYGQAENEMVSETKIPQPLSVYAETKLLGERALLELQTPNFDVYCLRNATVYGCAPSFRCDVVVNTFVWQALTTHQLTIHHQGKAWRPLIHIQDISTIFQHFLKLPHQVGTGITNVGFNQHNVQVGNIAQAVATHISGTQCIFTQHEPPDQRSYRVDFQKLARLFPDMQPTSLDTGIEELVHQLTPLTHQTQPSLWTRINHLIHLQHTHQLTEQLTWNPTLTATSATNP